MKTIIQFLLAKLKLWAPEVGAIYQADKKFKVDPFNPGKRPEQVQVVAVKEGFVKYIYLDVPSHTGASSEIDSFACYYVKAKVNYYEV